MFILTDGKTGGVYAVTPNGKNDPKGPKAVQIFVDKDDAIRYNLMLEANDYDRKLDVLEVVVPVV